MEQEKFQKKLGKLLAKFGVGDDKLQDALDYYTSLKDEDQPSNAATNVEPGDDSNKTEVEKENNSDKQVEEAKEETKENIQDSKEQDGNPKVENDAIQQAEKEEEEKDILKNENVELSQMLTEANKRIDEQKDVIDSLSKRVDNLMDALKKSGVIGEAPRKQVGIDESRVPSVSNRNPMNDVTELFNQRRN